MAEKVRVRITGRETVRYNQIVEMPLKEWLNVKAMSEKNAAQDLHDRLRYEDADFDGLDDDFEVEVVDGAGKTISPRDFYDV